VVGIENLLPAEPGQGSSSAKTQNARSMLFDKRQLSTARLDQSMTATK
jgi:hypothetical protein